MNVRILKYNEHRIRHVNQVSKKNSKIEGKTSKANERCEVTTRQMTKRLVDSTDNIDDREGKKNTHEDRLTRNQVTRKNNVMLESTRTRAKPRVRSHGRNRYLEKTDNR